MSTIPHGARRGLPSRWRRTLTRAAHELHSFVHALTWMALAMMLCIAAGGLRPVPGGRHRR